MRREPNCRQQIEEVHQAEALARECAALTGEPRPEQALLQRWFVRAGERMGISRFGRLDQQIAERMGNPDAAQKIRFWRTGQHVPANRGQCLQLSAALELDEAETRELLTVCFDRSDRVFTEEEAKRPSADYRERAELLRSCQEEYLQKIHPDQMLRAGVSPQELTGSLRHLYYLDALSYIGPEMPAALSRHHGGSAGYDAEFRRQMRLIGEIPRAVMLRHLFLLGMPFLSGEILSQRLAALGYAPLAEEHTTVRGARLDRMVLRLMAWYEEACRGEEPEECMSRMRNVCRAMDRVLRESGAQELRFLYFKGLDRPEHPLINGRMTG